MFAAGAGPGSGPERKLTMDHGGAVKLIAAAKQAGISRYVIVSSMGADANAPGDDTFGIYLQAKGKADDDLRASGLDYTVVKPGGLTNDAGTGRVESGRVGRPRAGAARRRRRRAGGGAGRSEHVGKTAELVSGDVPVEEAVEAL